MMTQPEARSQPLVRMDRASDQGHYETTHPMKNWPGESLVNNRPRQNPVLTNIEPPPRSCILDTINGSQREVVFPGEEMNITRATGSEPHQAIEKRSTNPIRYSVDQIGSSGPTQTYVPGNQELSGQAPVNTYHARQQPMNFNAEQNRRGPESHSNPPSRIRQAQTPHVSFSNQNVYHSNDQCVDQSQRTPTNNISQPEVINVERASERSRSERLTTPPRDTEPANTRVNQNSVSGSTSAHNDVQMAMIETLTALTSKINDNQNQAAVEEAPSRRSNRGGMTVRGKYYKSCRDEIIGNKSTRFDFSLDPNTTSLPTILFSEAERRITDFNYNAEDILLLLGKIFDRRLRGEAEAREEMERILKYTDSEGRSKRKDLTRPEVRKQVYIGLIEYFLGKKEIEIPKMKNCDQLPDLYYNIKLSLELGKFTSNMTRQQRDIEVLDRLEDQSNGLINSESLRRRLINYADNANIRERLEDGEEVDFEKFLKKVQKAEDKDSRNKSKSVPINLCQWDLNNQSQSQPPMMYMPVNQIANNQSSNNWTGNNSNGGQWNRPQAGNQRQNTQRKPAQNPIINTGYTPRPNNQAGSTPAVSKPQNFPTQATPTSSQATAPAVRQPQNPPVQTTSSQVRPPQNRGQIDHQHKKKSPGAMFVGNIPWKTTEDQLTSVFKEFGEVEKVHIAVNKETNRSRGFAHVSFLNKNNEAVKKCFARHAENPLMIGDRTLRLDQANEKPPRQDQSGQNSGTGSGTSGGIMNGIKLSKENSIMTSEGRFFFVGRGVDPKDVGVNCMFPNGRICKAQLDSCCFPDGAINLGLVKRLGMTHLLQEKITPIVAANDQKFKATQVLKCVVQIGASVFMEVELVVCHTGSKNTFLAGLPIIDRLKISEKMREECRRLDEEMEKSIGISKNCSEGANSQ